VKLVDDNRRIAMDVFRDLQCEILKRTNRGSYLQKIGKELLIEMLEYGKKKGIHEFAYPEIFYKLIDNKLYNTKLWELLDKKIGAKECTPSNYLFFRYSIYTGIFSRIDTAYCGLDKWKFQKKEDRNTKCVDIIKLSDELRKKIKGTPFDSHELRSSTDAINSFIDELENLNNVKEEGELHLVTGVDPFDNVGVYSPPISEMLIGLAEDAKKEMASDDDVISKVNTKDANITYFVRLMSDWCLQCFGTPCHEIVSLITSSIYEQLITAENVRSKLKGYSRSNGEIEYTKKYKDKRNC
jgi:hypothetical protein